MSWFGSKNTITKGALPLAPPPASPSSLLGDLTPPDASQTRSNATADAIAASARAKKKAAGANGGTLATAPLVPPAASTVLKPKSLIGY